MKYTNESTFPGPGDSATWPQYTGHPNDPRRPPDPEDFSQTDRELNQAWLDIMEEGNEKNIGFHSDEIF